MVIWWDVCTYDITNFNIAPITAGTAFIMKKFFLEYCQIHVGVVKAACDYWQTISKKESQEIQNNKLLYSVKFGE